MIRAGYLNLSVPTATINCEENSCTSQSLNSFVNTCQRICILHDHRAELSVEDTKTTTSVFHQEKHRGACSSQYIWFAHGCFEHSVNLLNFVLSRLQPRPIGVSEYWTAVWFQTSVMLNGCDLSQSLVPHAQKLGWKSRDVSPYGFFLAAGVDLFSALFWVCVGFLRGVLFKTVAFIGSPSPSSDWSRRSLKALEIRMRSQASRPCWMSYIRKRWTDRGEKVNGKTKNGLCENCSTAAYLANSSGRSAGKKTRRQ